MRTGMFASSGTILRMWYCLGVDVWGWVWTSVTDVFQLCALVDDVVHCQYWDNVNAGCKCMVSVTWRVLMSVCWYNQCLVYRTVPELANMSFDPTDLLYTPTHIVSARGWSSLTKVLPLCFHRLVLIWVGSGVPKKLRKPGSKYVLNYCTLTFSTDTKHSQTAIVVWPEWLNGDEESFSATLGPVANNSNYHKQNKPCCVLEHVRPLFTFTTANGWAGIHMHKPHYPILTDPLCDLPPAHCRKHMNITKTLSSLQYVCVQPTLHMSCSPVSVSTHLGH